MSSKGFKIRLAMRIEQHDRVESIKTLESLVETLLAVLQTCTGKSPVFLSTSQVKPGSNFSQLSKLFFAQPCTGLH